MLQFYFIRHGQSTNNHLWDTTHQSVGRSEDPDLTPLGWYQARLLGQFLATGNPRGGNFQAQETIGFGLTHLYTSLMTRAVETASAIAEAVGIPMQAWDDVYEEGGIYLEDETTGARRGLPGKSREYFLNRFPGMILPEDLPEEGWYAGREFEDPEVRPERASRFLAALLEKHGNSDDRVAVVSHGGFYNHFLSAVLGKTGSSGFWAVMNNVGITRIDFHDPYADLIYHNRTDFLPEGLIT